MMLLAPPTVYLPEESVDTVRQLLAVYTRLDRGKLQCNLVGLKSGDVIELSRELVVSVHRTYHTLPSLGYIVWERRKKLKPEYLTLAGEEIRDLKNSGVEISYEIKLPRVAYLGDSTCRGLDENPEMYEADVLITELTFVAPEHRREAIQKFGHIHLDDLKKRRPKFKNQLIIASHFSSRYHEREIEQAVRKQIPDFFDDRLMLWM